MKTQIADALERIIETVVNLLDSNLHTLLPSQREAVELIGVYASDLCDDVRRYEQDSGQREPTYFRSDMIDTLTTIAGYAEMLADGWIGMLEEQPLANVQQLRDQVRLLIPIVHRTLAQPSQSAVVS